MTKSISSKRYGVLCDLLVEARQSAGVTQSELAAKLGRPQSFVSKFEHGERRLDVIEFVEVAQALDADPARIIKKLLRG